MRPSRGNRSEGIALARTAITAGFTFSTRSGKLADVTALSALNGGKSQPSDAVRKGSRGAFNHTLIPSQNENPTRTTRSDLPAANLTIMRISPDKVRKRYCPDAEWKSGLSLAAPLHGDI